MSPSVSRPRFDAAIGHHEVSLMRWSFPGWFCLGLALLVGCGGGESTHAKMMRMAQERSKIRAAEEDRMESSPGVSQDSVETEPAPTAGPESNVRPDSSLSGEPGSDSPQSDPTSVPAEATIAAAPVPTVQRSRARTEALEQSQGLLTPYAPSASEPSTTTMLLAFARHDEHAAVVDERGSIGIYDVANKSLTRQIFNPQLQPLSIAISDRSSLLAVGGKEGHFRVFPIATASSIDRFEQIRLMRLDSSPPRKAHETGITAVAIDEAAGLAASGDRSGLIKLWRGSLESSVELNVDSERITQLAYSLDGRHLIGASDRRLFHWDSTSPGLPAGRFHGIQSESSITSIAISSDGETLLVGDDTGRLTAWTIENDSLQSHTLVACSGKVANLAFAKDDKSFVTVSSSGELSHWRLPIESPVQFRTAQPSSLAVSVPGGQVIGLASFQRNLDLHDSSNGQAIRRHTINDGELTAADFSGDGETVALGNSKGRVYFQDAARRTIAYLDCGSSPIVQLARSNDESNRFAFITADGKAGTASFASQPEPPLDIEGELACVNQNGSVLIVARGSTLKSVALNDGHGLGVTEVNDQAITAICIAGESAAFGTESGSLWTWKYRLPGAAPVACAQQTHAVRVIAVGVNSAGELLSCDETGTVLKTAIPDSESRPEPRNSEEPGTEVTSTPLFQVSDAPTAAAIESNHIYVMHGPSVTRWNDGAAVGLPPFPSQNKLTQLAIDHSGTHMAACDATGHLMIDTGDESGFRSLQLPVDGIRTLIWSGDGSHVAASNGKRIVMINTASGEVDGQCAVESSVARFVGWLGDDLWFLDSNATLQRMRVPRIFWNSTLDDEGVGVAWSAAGDTVAALGRSGTIIQVEAQTGKEISRSANGKNESRSLVAIPDSGSFAFLASNADVMLLRDDGRTKRLAISSALGLRALGVSADGEKLLATNALGRVVCWNLTRSGSETPEFDVSQSTASVLPCDLACRCLLPLDANRILAVGQRESLATVLLLSQLSQRTVQIGGPPSSVVVSTDATMAGYVDDSNTLRLVSLQDDRQRQLRHGDLKFYDLSIDSTGSRAATLAKSPNGKHTVLVWNGITNEVEASLELSDAPRRTSYSGSGAKLAIEYEDGHCEIRDSATLTLLDSTPSVDGLQAFAFSADGTEIIQSTAEGRVSRQPLHALGQAVTGQNAIVALRFLGENPTRLVCGSRNGRISIWDTDNLSKPSVTLQGISGPLAGCDVSQDQRLLCAVYEDASNTVCVWNVDELATGETPVPPSQVIHNTVANRCAVFSDDSRYLLVGTGDGNVFTWKLDENQLVATFSRHGGPVLDIRPNSESGVFLSGGEDRRVKTSQIPADLPSAGRAVLREVMLDNLELTKLELPDSLTSAFRDPNDAARQALVSGASASDVLDLIEGDENRIEAAKQTLSKLLSLESGSSTDAAELSRQRRDLFASQRRLAPGNEARSLSSFADNFSNLAFVAETNFKFGTEREFRPVRLMFADRYLYAARTSAALGPRRRRAGEPIPDVGDNGALLSWDYRYTRLQAHAWSIDNLSVQELFPLPQSAGVFTAPQIMLFAQDGSTRELATAAKWAMSNLPSHYRQFLAVGSEGTHRTESDILKVFDVADLTKEVVAPLSQYRGFEGVVTAMAFANQSPHIAFCVRSRAVHRLFLADAETLELRKLDEVNHDKPWIEVDTDSFNTRRNTAAAPGITSLAFSPDDRVLVAHGNYSGTLHKFSQWQLSWNQDRQLVDVIKSNKELENESGPLIRESGSKSIWFVQADRRDESESRSSGVQPRVSSSNTLRVLVRVEDGFSVVNLNANREEHKFAYLPTHHGRRVDAVSDDGRWLIMGDDSGLACVWNTLEGDRYAVTIDPATEEALRAKRMPRDVPERPAHTGPVVGVAISPADPGRDYPAFAATFGEENKVKVWELFPILDPDNGIRSKSTPRSAESRSSTP